jgi:hypothetical protein
LLRGRSLSPIGKALQLLDKLGALEGWVPAYAGKTPNGFRLDETRSAFIHTPFRNADDNP